jgi:hypothetical protein
MSTGVGVAFGVQAVPIKATTKPIIGMHKNFKFTLLLWKNCPTKKLFGFLLDL